MVTESELANSWLQHFRTFWVTEAVDELIERAGDGERAWRFLGALLALASPGDLESIGAGPLERFVKRHGTVYIDRIEQAAASDPKFAKALGHVWIEANYHPADVMSRLVDASGGLLAPTGTIGRPDA